MFNVNRLYEIIDNYAPFSLSQQCIDKGSYDNSGILVKSKDGVNKVLFSLDLSNEVVKRAKRLGCDTIVTHHPAIYAPLKEVSSDGLLSSAVCLALNYKMNVISAHLNLDVAKFGIDYYLAWGLGKNSQQKIFDKLSDGLGYGREFSIDTVSLGEFIGKIKKEFDTNKVIVYGSKNKKINCVASFCGSGSGDIEKLLKNNQIKADVIVSSDIPHHVIKECVELGYSVIILTHYSAENYGFKKAYEYVNEQIGKEIKCEFFTDVRFK